MYARATIASVGVAMDPFDVVDELTIGGRSPALRARAPGIITGRRYLEHLAQDSHRIISAAIFDEAKSHFGTPAKIAIDFLRNSHLSAEGNRLQNEAQRLGAPLQIGEDTAAILFLILVSTRIPVGHAVPDGIVEQDCDLAGGRRHGLRLSGTRRQPAIERSEGC